MTHVRPLCMLLVLLLSAGAAADANTESNLKTIMQTMQSDAALIVEGLLVEDFDTVENAALRIADHPRIPPAQVARVATELGAEMPAFKQFDTRVHDLALYIAAAARRADANAVAADYKAMLDGCLGCHALFRERVSGVLAGN